MFSKMGVSAYNSLGGEKESFSVLTIEATITLSKLFLDGFKGNGLTASSDPRFKGFLVEAI
jgi:hypothetical protein